MRLGRVNLRESYAQVRNGEVFVQSMHISPYEQGSIFNTDPMRPKKLLLNKSEIRKLAGLVQRKGYTLIPLQVYLKDGLMKLELGVCVGKQLHDKRDDLAERDAQRDSALRYREWSGLRRGRLQRSRWSGRIRRTRRPASDAIRFSVGRRQWQRHREQRARVFAWSFGGWREHLEQ